MMNQKMLMIEETPMMEETMMMEETQEAGIPDDKMDNLAVSATNPKYSPNDRHGHSEDYSTMQ